jgi:hypothetical protein
MTGGTASLVRNSQEARHSRPADGPAKVRIFGCPIPAGRHRQQRVKMSRILRQSCQTHMVLFARCCARSLDAHPRSRVSRGSCPYFGCYQITSRGSDLHPPAAPPGERYALSREERAGTRRISRLLIERTIPAICIGLRRFCNVIAPSRGRITWIQCRQVGGMSSATDKEACNRNKRARN